MQIEKILSASTGHVTENDMDMLSLEESFLVFSDEYGALVNLMSWIGASEADELGDNYSEAFVKICKFAIKHEEGFTWLKLDCDADTLENFPTFDW